MVRSLGFNVAVKKWSRIGRVFSIEYTTCSRIIHRPTPCHSGCANPFAERVIGSMRRECIDHVIVLSESYLRRILRDCFEYYHESRTHLSQDRNAPIPREVEPPFKGRVVAIPQLGGLHHRYAS